MGTTVASQRRLRLLHVRPFLTAALVSVASVVILFVYLMVASTLLLVVSGVLVGLARTNREMHRATLIASTAFGFATGPAIYLALWAIQR